MADDWEAEDWEREDFKPKLPATAAPQFETAGEAILARAAGPDPAKFADEDEGDDDGEDERAAAAAAGNSAQPRKAPAPKKYADKEGMGARPPGDGADDTPLDDPLAERLRRQRLVEESDLAAARELFGGGKKSSAADGGAGAGPADALASEQARMRARLESLAPAGAPKALRDFEEVASLAAKLYFLPHAGAKHYKALLKAFLRAACEPLGVEDAREVETCASAVRAEKAKAEKAAAAARAAKGRRAVNAGAGGGAGGSGIGGGAGKSAGLDEYVFDDAGDGDDFDFM